MKKLLFTAKDGYCQRYFYDNKTISVFVGNTLYLDNKWTIKDEVVYWDSEDVMPDYVQKAYQSYLVRKIIEEK